MLKLKSKFGRKIWDKKHTKDKQEWDKSNYTSPLIQNLNTLDL